MVQTKSAATIHLSCWNNIVVAHYSSESAKETEEKNDSHRN